MNNTVDKVDIMPGESREFVIPAGLIDEAKKKGLKTAKLRLKYDDANGKEHERVFEIDIETMEIKEI